jgi:hypothetical protein
MTTNSSSNIMSIPSEKQKMIKPMIGPVSDSFSTGSRVNLEQEHIVSIDGRQSTKFQIKLNVILLCRSTTISLSMPLNWVLNLEDR